MRAMAALPELAFESMRTLTFAEGQPFSSAVLAGLDFDVAAVL